MTTRRAFQTVLPAALAVMSGLWPAIVGAQPAWPSKPIRMVVPYTPGGYTDSMARMLGEAIAKPLGQPFVYENKPGANSLIGAGIVAQAAPDGYSFVTVIAAHAANPSLYEKMPFDAIKSFVPVTLISIGPLMLVAGPNAPFSTVGEMIAFAKANPGKLNYGSSGQGAAAHLAMEYLALQTGTAMNHVPYKGTAPALADLLGGQIHAMFDTVSSLAPQAAAKKVKPLGVASAKRLPAIADVPTIIESGVTGFEAATWAMVLAPAGTPAAIVDRVADESGRAVAAPAFSQRLDQMGLIPVGSTSAEAAKFLEAEVAKWGRVVRAAKVTIGQ